MTNWAYSWKSFTVIDENSIGTDSNFSTGDSFTYAGADATMYVRDNDGGLAGDSHANEYGNDNQCGWVDENGTWTEAGNVYWEGYYVMHGSDGQTYFLIEIEGTKLCDGGNDYFAFYGKVPAQGVELTAACYYNDCGSLSYAGLSGGEIGSHATPPAADDDFLALMQGEGFGDTDINVLLNDESNTSEALIVKEVDGSAGLVGVWVDLADGGRILVSADGTVDFDAAGDFDALAEGQTATVSIDYLVLNSDGLTDTATLTVQVTGVNDAPVAVDQAVTTDEDTAVTGNVMDGAYDIDGDVVSLDGISLGAIGEEIAVTTANGYTGTVVVNADGTFVYTPGPDADDMAQGDTDTFSFDFTVKSQNGFTTIDNTRIIDFETGEAIVTYVDGAGNPGNDKPVGSVGEDPNGTGSEDNGTTVGNSDGFGVDGTTTSGGGDLHAGDVITTQIEGMTISVQANAKGGKYDEAMIFDSNNPTGGDYDLATNTQNNVLIISEDGDSCDPDDNAKGGEIRFSFDEPEDVKSLTVIDNEEGVWIGFYDENWCKTGSQWVPCAPDNSIQTVALNGQNVSHMIVILEGSGAIDDLVLGNTVEVPAYLYDTATVTVTITGESDGPTAVADIATTDEDTTVSGNVIENDLDAAGYSVIGLSEGTVGEAFEVTSTGGRTGLLTVNADGSYTFAPNDGFDDLSVGDTDTLSVSYSLGTDGVTAETTADLNITVTGLNSGPVAVDIALSMNEAHGRDTQPSTVSGNLLDGATDSDGDVISLASTTLGAIGSTVDVITTGGRTGTLEIGADGAFTFTSTDDGLDLTQTDTLVFDYTVASDDGSVLRTDTKTVTITINGVNEAPVAIAQSATVTEQNTAGLASTVSGDLLDGATDFDGDTVSLASTSLGAIGSTLNVTTDGGRSGELTINADGTFTFLSTDDSLDLGQSDTLSFDFTVQSTGGATVQTGSSTATININGYNAAPVTIDSTFTVSEANAQGLASTLTGNLLDGATDAEGDAISIFSTTIGAVGETVTIEVGPGRFADLTIQADGSFTLTSLDDTLDLNASDLVEIGFTAVSSGGTTPQFSSSVARISIEGVNVAPDAGDVSADVFEQNTQGLDSTVEGNLLANSTDTDGDTMYISSTSLGAIGETVEVVTTGGRTGLLTIGADGSYSFTSTSPDLDVNQTDTVTFEFTVSSTGGTTVQNAPAIATINIAGVNVAPTAVDQFYTTTEDEVLRGSDGNPVNVLLGASDPDGDNVTLQSVSDGIVISTPRSAVDNPIVKNGVIIGYLNVFVDGTLRYTPTAEAAEMMNDGDVDEFSFQFTVASTDGVTVQTDTKTVSITILGQDDVAPNTPPIAQGEVIEIDETQIASGDLNALTTDADDGDVVTIDTVQGQAFDAVNGNTIELTSNANGWTGTLTVAADGTFDFDPSDQFLALNNGDSEIVSFTYSASDTSDASAGATIDIIVNGISEGEPAAADVNYYFLIDASSSMFTSTGAVDCDNNGDGITSWVDLSIGMADLLGGELPIVWEDNTDLTTSTSYYTYGSVATQVDSPTLIDGNMASSTNLNSALQSLTFDLDSGVRNEVFIFTDGASSSPTLTQTFTDLGQAGVVFSTFNVSNAVSGASDVLDGLLEAAGQSNDTLVLNDCDDVEMEGWSIIYDLEDALYQMS